MAGHYEVLSNTTGISATSSPGSHTVTPNPGSVTASFGGGSGSGGISGAATTTFTWIPDKDPVTHDDLPGDVAPEKVIIVHTCSVSADAKCYPGSPTASASNGLGSTWSTNSSSTPPIYVIIPYPPYSIQIGTEAIASSTGTKAEIKNGGDSVDASATISVSANASNGPFSGDLTYSVAIYPITVSLTNVTKWHGFDHFLPGKKTTASLACSAPDVSISSGTYSWDIPGSIFDSFYVSSGQDVGNPVNVPSSAYTSSNPSWAWTEEYSSDVTGSATFTYKGTSIGTGSGLREAIIIQPESELILIASTSAFTDSSGIHSRLSPDRGIEFNLRANVPGYFAVSGYYGELNLTQLITLDRRQQRLVGPDDVDTSDHALDNTFPYHGTYPCEAYPGGAYLTDDDNPNDGFGSLVWDATINDLYEPYLMFVPPGGGEWVNLRKAAWTWQAHSENISGSWVQHYNSVIASSSSEYTTQPYWTTKWP